MESSLSNNNSLGHTVLQDNDPSSCANATSDAYRKDRPTNRKPEYVLMSCNELFNANNEEDMNVMGKI